MRVLSDCEFGYVNGAGPTGNGGSSIFNDNRNQSQKDADARLAELQKGCTGLGSPTCKYAAAVINYTNQREEYTICKASGGEDGADGCGESPVPPKP